MSVIGIVMRVGAGIAAAAAGAAASYAFMKHRQMKLKTSQRQNEIKADVDAFRRQWNAADNVGMFESASDAVRFYQKGVVFAGVLKNNGDHRKVLIFPFDKTMGSFVIAEPEENDDLRYYHGPLFLFGIDVARSWSNKYNVHTFVKNDLRTREEADKVQQYRAKKAEEERHMGFGERLDAATANARLKREELQRRRADAAAQTQGEEVKPMTSPYPETTSPYYGRSHADPNNPMPANDMFKNNRW